MNLYNAKELKLEDLNSCNLALLCQTENLLSRLHQTKQHQDLRQNILCKSSSKKQKQKKIHFIVKQIRKLQVKSKNNSGSFRLKVKTIQEDSGLKSKQSRLHQVVLTEQSRLHQKVKAQQSMLHQVVKTKQSRLLQVVMTKQSRLRQVVNSKQSRLRQKVKAQQSSLLQVVKTKQSRLHQVEKAKQTTSSCKG